MKPINKFVIYNELTDELLHKVKKEGGMKMYGWCQHLASAFKYLSHSDAIRTAQKIANKKQHPLFVCELHESDSQFGLGNSTEVTPSL